MADANAVSLPEPTGFQVTKEFLEFLLKNPVETFASKSGSNPGDNYLSIMFTVDVTLKGKQNKYHLLIKCYPEHPARREYLDQTNVFEKELFMYANFFPQLQQLAVSSGAKDELSLSLAPYHGGNVVGSSVAQEFKDSPWSNQNFLVMTDLRKAFGCKMAERIQGLDLAHTKLVMVELAKLHALTWAYKQKNGITSLITKYKWFKDTMYTEKELEQWKPLMDNANESTIKVVKKVLGEEHPVYKNLQVLLAKDTLAIISENMKDEGIDEEKQESYLRVKPKGDMDSVKEPWLVGAHGDCWINNMLFLYDANSGQPAEVTLIDFQVIHEACPTTDLAYFFFSSVRAPIRIKHENDILRAYFDAFTKYCKILEVEPLPGFTFETLQRRYRRSKLLGFLIGIMMLSFIFKPKEECKNMDQQEGENIMELFSEEMEGIENNRGYKDEIIATVLSLYEDGVI